MAKRTYEIEPRKVEFAEDFEEIVKDKREGWRANTTKARQRRYKNRLSREILKNYETEV